MLMFKKTIAVIAVLVTVLTLSGCATTYYSPADMRSFSDLKVCQNYLSERNWRNAKDEMQRRNITREECIDLLSVRQQQGLYHSPYLHDPFFYSRRFYSRRHDVIILE